MLRKQTSQARVSPDTPPPLLRQLAAAVIVQAVRDLRSAQPVRQVDALIWLASDDAPLWFEYAGIAFVDPYKMLAAGAKKQKVDNGKDKRTRFNLALYQARPSAG